MAEQRTAKIAVSAAKYAIDLPYTYLLTGELCETAVPGMRVMVPFGAGNRPTEGVVLAVCDEEPPEGRTLKQVLSRLDDTPVLDRELIQLALWMHERLFCTVYEAIRVMLPAGLYYSLKNVWGIAEGIDRETAYAAAKGNPSAEKLLDTLYAYGGKTTEENVRAAFGTASPDRALKLLQKAGAAAIDGEAARQVGDKTEKQVSLAISPEEAIAAVEPQRKRWPVRYTVVELLTRLEQVPMKELCYFTGASETVIRTMVKKGILKTEKVEVLRSAAEELPEPEEPPRLNEEQSAAYEGITALMETGDPSCSLLYGVTGSGKTAVYISLIHECLRRGKTALVLVPEIALTPQLLRRFRAQFGERVAVLHSMLSAGVRYDEWKRVRSGNAQVVVGTRSAVFAPLNHLGLLILDEEQEYSYKSEQNPRYHAVDIAKYRCVQNHAALVLGSATPSVESMFLAKSGKYHLFTMRRRYNQKSLPQVMTVDLKEELRAGNPHNLSRTLQNEIADNLANGEQTILFLNRRGSYKQVVCSECGAVPMCDRCSVALTYHRDNNRLMCHYCGSSRPMPRICPECGGTLTMVGCGTQKIEEELKELFPGTKVLRMDTDTVSASNPHEKILGRFEQEKVPILVGTQMVAKGLDFENVTLVGVVNADQSLYVEDYRAAERTFSLLTQVVGRAGRGERKGRAVIQTCTPKNTVLRLASVQDYDSFYEEEISLRSLQRYPPYAAHYRLTLTGEDEGAVLRTAVRIRDGALRWAELPALKQADTRVLGPAAANILRVNERYRYFLNIYGTDCAALRNMVSELLKAAFKDKNNQGVTVFADRNPYE